MGYFKKTVCLILCILLTFSLCSCGEDESSAIIFYGVNEVPRTIDPQKANSSIELMIVRNLFEGLLRENSNGEIINGVITDYKKSGNTYIFNIKEDALWSDDTPLTANDFVFAFRRALLPETAAPHAKSLYCIKNAKQVNEGKLNASALGVFADDDKTFRIELGYDDSEFLSTLTTAICMPCNEEFFNKSIGKYGMSGETTLADGTYKMRKWVTEDFAMRIIKNQNYNGNFTAKNAAVYFSKNKDLNNLECLDKNYFDIAAIDVSNSKSAKDKGYTVLSLNNKVIVMSISKDYPKDMRKALYLCSIGHNDFKDNNNIKVAKTIYPEILKVENISENNFYNPTCANEMYFKQYNLMGLDEFPQTAISYFGDDETSEVAKCVAGHWQQYLGIYINVSPVKNIDALDYLSESQKYSIVMYSSEITQGNIDEYLSKLKTVKTDNLQKTQDRIISEYSTIPLAYASSYYAYSKKLSNVNMYSSNGIFDFSQMQKED